MDSSTNPPSRLDHPAGELTEVKGLHAKSVSAFPFISEPTVEGTLGVFGPYTVLRFLGSGSAGFVFLAEDPELHRPMAIKILRPDLAEDPDHRKRFLREARAAAALVSDHTVPIYYVGEIDGLPYLAMMYLGGETLQARLGRKGHLPVPAALEIARQVALGLADAHDHGLIHRDIKPANLWLEADRDKTPGAVRRVRILDFGLARTLESTAASGRMSGAIVGTPQFMSPEQTDGATLDPRSDLFSLGSVLYTMLVGTTPFQGPTLAAILKAVAAKNPPPPDTLVPSIPRVVSDFVMELLAKDREARPAAAEMVAARLGRMLQLFPPDNRRLDQSVSPSQDRASFLAHSSVRCMSDPTVPMTLEVPAPNPRPSGQSRMVIACTVAAVLPALLGIFWLGAAVGKARNTTGASPADPPAVVEPILVGVLHSRTGSHAGDEGPVIDATLLAIEEVNAEGGVLGRPVKAVVADGASDPAMFAAEAERLLLENKVSALFGGYTSASRRTIRPVVERNNGLLFYPVAYEGLEQSPRTVYCGATANQFLLPAVDDLKERLSAKRFFLVGSDAVYSRSVAALIEPQVEIAGSSFQPFGATDWQRTLAAIAAAKPDVILSTVGGGAGNAFYRQWRAHETANKLPRTPILSIRMSENELRVLNPADTRGDYIAGSYFESVATPASRDFTEKIRRKYGADRTVSDSMAAAYVAVHLWKNAAEKAGKLEPTAVLERMRGSTFQGPRGAGFVDSENQHLWLPFRIARVNDAGRAEILPGTGTHIRPLPFPDSRTRPEWDRFLNDLYLGWNGRWYAQPR